jgi:prepilin-type N-terminal cleavage/methylation domain-containing protein
MNRHHEHQKGFTLAEALVAVALLGLLAGLGTVGTQRQLARMRVEAAIRRVATGIEAGRAAALRMGRPCGLALSEAGWLVPAGGGLSGCAEAVRGLSEGVAAGEVHLSHTLPEEVRFSANGLVLDGGTVVVGARAPICAAAW